MEIPFFTTKSDSSKKFNLNDPKERAEYFEFKAGPEIKKLRDYFEKGNTFIAYLLGKKSSGKGTCAKMFSEVVAPDYIEHLSVGDIVRQVDIELQDEDKKKELISFLEKNYRGWLPLEELIQSLENRSTKVLLPTELVLALLKREISKRDKKTIFLDGFPRELDQINFALFFRDLIGYREDPDFLVLIDVPETIIDERIKCRVVCPACQTSRSVRLLPTSKVGYDEKAKEYYLICDNPKCQELRMVRKEGDELGIEPIKARLEKDAGLMKQALSLYGIPKVLLRNSVPTKLASTYLDDYEITPEYYYEQDKENNKIITKEKPWIIPDDKGEPSYSLLPPPIVVSFIKQLVDILNL